MNQDEHTVTHDFATNQINLIGTDEFSVSLVHGLLTSASDLYTNGDEDSFLTDSEYDLLERALRDVDPTNAFFIGVGSPVRGGKVTLPYEMGSLDQVYENETVKWIADNDLKGELIVITDKMDGTSAQIIYDDSGDLQIAYSRGDGTEGADITRHLKQIKSLPNSIKAKSMVFRAECEISETNFKILLDAGVTRSGGKPYKNPRNMIAGIMNSSEPNPIVYDYISVIVYEITNAFSTSKYDQLELISQLGFHTVVAQYTPASSINDAFLTKYLNKRRNDIDFAIDGIVLDVNNEITREDMNPTKSTLNPAYSVKFKVASEDNLAHVVVIGINWNISKHGYIKPQVELTPTELMGVTVTYASGFNAKFIVDNCIGEGSVIELTRSGDVTPYIQDVISPSLNGKPLMPDMEYEWNDTEVDIVITSVEDNDTVDVERAIDFFTSISVPNLKKGSVTKLFEAGYNTVQKIIKLPKSRLVDVIGANGEKIFNGMCAKLHAPVTVYDLAGATHYFGRGMGARKIKKLYEAYGTITDLNLNQIMAVDGYDVTSADKFLAGVGPYEQFLADIDGYYTLEKYQKKSGNLDGLTVVFTGFRDKALQTDVENAGGKFGSAVSSRTHLVVTKNPGGNSTKLQKARSLNVDIISIEALRRKIG